MTPVECSFSVWLVVTTAWLLLLYFLYDYLVYFMIAIFCIFGASAMITVIYNNILIKLQCTESVTCPVRDVAKWKLCDCIPHYLCRSGLSVSGIFSLFNCLFKTACLKLLVWNCLFETACQNACLKYQLKITLVVILIICCFGFTITWFIFRHETWAWVLQGKVRLHFLRVNRNIATWRRTCLFRQVAILWSDVPITAP